MRLDAYRSTRSRTAKRKREADPIEQRIEAALQPGHFVSWRETQAFAAALEDVGKEIARLIPAEAERAVALYETFVAGCYAKAEEVDDEGGNLGCVVRDLYCGWVQARRAAGADPGESARTVLGWMEKDAYSLSSHVEDELVKVLEEGELDVFERATRNRWGEAPPTGGFRAAFQRTRWAEVLRALLVARRDIDGYVSFCEQTETTAKDCLAVAGLLETRSQVEDALSWVERGLELDARERGYQEDSLRRLQRKLLRKGGRDGDALASAWAEFARRPCHFAYEELMRYVAEAERASWHAKAVEAAAGASLDTVMGFMVEVDELERLVERLKGTPDAALEGLSHFTMEPAAAALAPRWPAIAARVYRALGVRIVKSAKSQYYGAALSHLAEARACWERCGQHAAWQQLVHEMYDQHRRKSSFMPGFERIVRGDGPEPSFLERARARWKEAGR